VYTLAIDLSVEGAAQQVFQAIESANLAVDILINNAGFGDHDLFHDCDLAKQEAMMRLNMGTLTSLTRLVLPGMIERGRGRVLNVASTAAFMPGPLQAVYYATKAYVLSFSQAITEELRDTGVSVTALCPGPVKTGFVALGLVLPMTIYLASRFVFSDDDAARAAGQLISADVRQPHHAKPELWFDRDAMIQLVIVLAGLILSYRNKRLFVVLLVCTLLAGGLTVLQVFTGDLSLALIFPWRTSVWLVPACSAVLLGYAVRWIGRTADRFVGGRSPASATRGVTALAAAGLIGFCLIGVQRTASNLAEDRRLSDHATFAKSYARPGQAYLIPTHLQRFRLRAGVPTYVDWKSFPYRSSEILVWHDRFETAEAFYAAEDGDTAAAALAAVQENQTITHVVLPVDRRHLVAALDAAVIYEGEDYLVVELMDATQRSAIAG